MQSLTTARSCVLQVLGVETFVRLLNGRPDLRRELERFSGARLSQDIRCGARIGCIPVHVQAHAVARYQPCWCVETTLPSSVGGRCSKNVERRPSILNTTSVSCSVLRITPSPVEINEVVSERHEPPLRPISGKSQKHERPIFPRENRPFQSISGRGDWI